MICYVSLPSTLAPSSDGVITGLCAHQTGLAVFVVIAIAFTQPELDGGVAWERTSPSSSFIHECGFGDRCASRARSSCASRARSSCASRARSSGASRARSSGASRARSSFGRWHTVLMICYVSLPSTLAPSSDGVVTGLCAHQTGLAVFVFIAIAFTQPELDGRVAWECTSPSSSFVHECGLAVAQYLGRDGVQDGFARIRAPRLAHFHQIVPIRTKCGGFVLGIDVALFSGLRRNGHFGCTPVLQHVGHGFALATVK